MGKTWAGGVESRLLLVAFISSFHRNLVGARQIKCFNTWLHSSFFERPSVCY
jgi:hypothetical protein